MDRVDWVPVSNGAGADIPSGSVARVTGSSAGILTVAQVAADGDPAVIVLDLVRVPTGGRGQGTFDPRVIVAYEPADGVPAAGETWGPAAGSWKIRKGRPGFRILGGSANGMTNALRVPGPGGPAPAAPTSLSATPGGPAQTISLVWTAPTGAPAPSQYIVAMSTSSDLSAAQFVATVPAGTTSATVSGLAAGTTYYFGVFAATALGASSPYSNVASAAAPSGPVPGTSAAAAPTAYVGNTLAAALSSGSHWYRLSDLLPGGSIKLRQTAGSGSPDLWSGTPGSLVSVSRLDTFDGPVFTAPGDGVAYVQVTVAETYAFAVENA